MIVFSICLMPLFYWSVQGLFENQDVRVKDVIFPFIKGVLFAIPAILFYWAMDVYFELTWSPLKIYFYSFLNKEGFLYLLPVLLLLWVYWKKRDGGLYYRELAGFFCGYFFMIASVDVLTGRVHTTFDMLILPIIRVMTLISAVVLINKLLYSSGKKKYGILACIFILPFLFNFFPVFYLLNKQVLLYVLLIPVSLAVIVSGYLDLQEKLPW